MSIWSDMEERGTGDLIKKEDYINEKAKETLKKMNEIAAQIQESSSRGRATYIIDFPSMIKEPYRTDDIMTIKDYLNDWKI